MKRYRLIVAALALCAMVSSCKRDSGAERMKAAIDAGSLAGVEKCVADGLDVNANLGGGATPLHLAALRGSAPIAAFLIGKGAKVDAADEMGFAPLHHAAATGSADVVTLLLAKGADVKLVNKLGENALSMLAGGSGEKFLAIARILVDAGIPLDPQSAQGGATPLIVAATHGNMDLVKLLLAKGADPSIKNAEGKTALALLRGVNNPGVLAQFQRLLDARLIEAILNGDAPRVKSSLAAGANPNAKTGIMSEWASQTNLSNIPGRNLSVLQFAEEQKNPEIIDMLQAAGAKE
ncbi:MAG TPA: ankyrin repeat domain-containing protein [Spirochaetota bacterium]|nr:ankyrin repeat domain-containing protein [Spirochaetota bacterium]HNT10066.1 ankyrin repeat domain-containing protein [Spirochaetota bacterium]